MMFEWNDSMVDLFYNNQFFFPKRKRIINMIMIMIIRDFTTFFVGKVEKKRFVPGSKTKISLKTTNESNLSKTGEIFHLFRQNVFVRCSFFCFVVVVLFFQVLSINDVTFVYGEWIQRIRIFGKKNHVPKTKVYYLNNFLILSALN